MVRWPVGAPTGTATVRGWSNLVCKEMGAVVGIAYWKLGHYGGELGGGEDIAVAEVLEL